MTREVFFIDLRVRNEQGLLEKITGLLERAGIERIIRKNRLTAVK
ncbi:MAG: 4Fe-4S ferredoxin, partial [Deltaproteobacteria bacterium]|nr:4Fe-4S ferredoxin [Deltaproteobacteria bacterium]